MSPAQFSIRQHILVNLLFYLCMIGGLIMLARVPVDFYPDISFNTTEITTEWTGASADEIERLVTTRIEDEIQRVSGVKTIRSSSFSNFSSIDVEWDETLSDDDYSSNLASLRAAVERVKDLPAAAEEPYVRELSVGEVYASAIVAVVDDGGVGELVLREVARDLQDRLDDLSGVRRATLRGVRDQEVRVTLDRHAIHAADLTLPEVVRIIQQNNQNIPAGSFVGAAGETVVRATGDFPSLEALAATIVRKHPDGTHIRLGELASIELGFEKQRLIGRYNGTPASMVEVAKENDADLINMVARVRSFLEERRPFLPPGVRTVISFDSAQYVETRLDALWNNLLFGVVAVTGLLWLTLGLRNALLAVMAIPFCYLTAIFLFPLLDLSLNSLSLAGMILVSGMLVDDAIIVLENIHRHIEEGVPLHEAVLHGADEVKWPVIASISTTIAAFSPLLLISGVSGEFMSILPKTVIVCLIASLIECLFALPAHYIEWGAWGNHPSARVIAIPARVIAAMQGRVDRGLDWLRRRYVSLLEHVLGNRIAFTLFLGGLAILCLGVGSRLPVDLFAGEYTQVFVSLYGPTHNSLQDTDQTLRSLEALFQEFESHEVRDFSAYAGYTMNPDAFPIFGPHLGVLYVALADNKTNREYPERMLQKIRDRLQEWREAHPDLAENVLALPPRDGPPVGKPIAVQIRSDDYQQAKEIAGEMKDYLNTLPGVFNVEDNLFPGAREIRLQMDEARASIHGLTFQDLAITLQGATDGIVASTFKPRDSDEDIDIRVLFADRYRHDAHDILRARLRTPQGYRIALDDVSNIDMDRGFLSLTHHDTRRSVIVYGDVVEGVTTSEVANRALMERFADLAQRYPDVEIVYGGEFQESAAAFANALRILPLAMLMIYIILAAQFRSYLQPFVVMCAVPFGVMGVILGLFIFGYPFSFSSMYVIVGLSGVVVNDSLVLVDFINRARWNGTPLQTAVLTAGQKRFRPVLLTTLTTVTALTPTAMGLFGRSISFGPFAAAFATGLALATLFTLLFVPTGYYTLATFLARTGSRNQMAAPAPMAAPTEKTA